MREMELSIMDHSAQKVNLAVVCNTVMRRIGLILPQLNSV